MNQTTAHLAALARALGGYPSPALCREHLIPMRALPPAVARRGLHVSAFPGRMVLEAAPPIQSFDGSTEGRARMLGHKFLAIGVQGVRSPARLSEGNRGDPRCQQAGTQARPVESLYRGERFLADLPTGRRSSRASLRNSPPAHFHFCLKAYGSDGVGGFFN